jgi:hypothetical protein
VLPKRISLVIISDRKMQRRASLTSKLGPQIVFTAAIVQALLR